MTRPFESMFDGWGVAGATPQLDALVAQVRGNEGELRRLWGDLGPDVAQALLWETVADGVPEALAWAGGAPLRDLCERALRLRGGPSGGRERRAMRERARIALHLMGPAPALPAAPEGLLSWWDEATRAEPDVHLRVGEARWRAEEDGVPFTGMASAWLYGPQPLPAGAETANPADIPGLVARLLAFIGRDDLAPEAVAAHMPHLVGFVHPFADGNGHTGRLLMADLLARVGVGAATLVSYTDVWLADKVEYCGKVRSFYLGQGEAADLVCAQLRMLLDAQGKARARALRVPRETVSSFPE